MKKIITLLLVSVFLVGCETPEREAMQGVPVSGQMEAYIKMCVRDPSSPLCPEDRLGITNSELNERWCRMCAEDSSYDWCRYFPECVTKETVSRTVNTMKSIVPKQEKQGEAMRGEPVRIRAQAFSDLCARDPNSVLCKGE